MIFAQRTIYMKESIKRLSQYVLYVYGMIIILIYYITVISFITISESKQK